MLVLLVAFNLLIPLAQAAPDYQPVVDYEMVVTLDQAINQLSGQTNVIWTNITDKATDELYLHLYPNAFKPGSTFIKESGGMLRGDRLSRDGYGGMDLEFVRLDNQDLSWQFVQPDDGNREDQTLARVQLPRMVQPGKSIRLHMNFTVTLPKVFARMGKHGQFVMAGQWFPKIAVYEPAGRRGRTEAGWSAHQYHGNTEFYADFGNYRVTINVPQTHTVAATGQMVRQTSLSNGQKQYVFEAKRVHDFAWAADSTFIEKQAVFSSPAQPEVRILLYLQPEHEHLADLYFIAARESLARLSQWFGAYPYSTLSIVCPTAGASGAGGMEYPTLVTGWDATVTNEDLLNTVLVHEIVHQYFYGLVASNEVEEAWLDEGFTSYIEDKIMVEALGRELDLAAEAQSVYSIQPLVLDGWKYPNSFSYQINVYLRAKLVLHEIESRTSWRMMQQVLRTYVNQYRYGHPGTADFQRVLEEVTKQNWQDFFDTHIYGAGALDYGIEKVTTKQQDSKYVSTLQLVIPEGEERELRFALSYSDGTIDERSILVGSSNEIVIEHELPLSAIEIDPYPHQVILDYNRLNNEYIVKPTSRWSAWLSYFLHLISQWLGW